MERYNKLFETERILIKKFDSRIGFRQTINNKNKMKILSQEWKDKGYKVKADNLTLEIWAEI